jgi:hypothetical protein
MLVMFYVPFQDYYKHKSIEHILILSGDQLYRMDYMELVQVCDCLFHMLYSTVCVILNWLTPVAHIIYRNMLMTMLTLLYHVPLLEKGIGCCSVSSIPSEVALHPDLFVVLEAGHPNMD